MVQPKSSSSTEILSSNQKQSGFHAKYLSVCKAKNLIPLAEVKGKSQNSKVLDFHADRLRPSDWVAICAALFSDKKLNFIAIRLRKNGEASE